LAAALSGTPISAKKSASSTLFVPIPLTDPAQRTFDNASGEKPTDEHEGIHALAPTTAQRRKALLSMMQRTAISALLGGAAVAVEPMETCQSPLLFSSKIDSFFDHLDSPTTIHATLVS
jgi:hypothetical protein